MNWITQKITTHLIQVPTVKAKHDLNKKGFNIIKTKQGSQGPGPGSQRAKVGTRLRGKPEKGPE